jgi:hypothetical protein
VLLIYGDHDQVVPVHDSAQRIVQALAHGGNNDYTARLMRGADHNLLSLDMAIKTRLVSAALEMMSDWVLERSAVPGEFARLPGTETVFELEASNEFGPEGRYDPNAAVRYVLAQLGLVLFCAVVSARAAWEGCKACFDQRSTGDRDLMWMRRTRLWLGLSGGVNLIALVFVVPFGLLGSPHLLGGSIAGDDPIWIRVTSVWSWLAVSVAAVLVLLLARSWARRAWVIRRWTLYGAHLIATGGLSWLLWYWRVLELPF